MSDLELMHERADEIGRLKEELATTELALRQAIEDCHMCARIIRNETIEECARAMDHLWNAGIAASIRALKEKS